MYNQVLFPDENNHSFEMPEQFFGKKVEVIVVEVADTVSDILPSPFMSSVISVMRTKSLLEFIPLSIYISCVLLILLAGIKLPLLTFFDAVLLAVIYMFLSFWLFNNDGSKPISRVFVGLVYMFAVLAIAYRLFTLYGNMVFVVIAYMLLGFSFINCLTQIKSPFYRKHFYRSLLFLVLLSLAYALRVAGQK